ncbi:MAG TPA: SIR2 family protein [bacterium]|nr:SIR2 family protein [bacterium]
MHIEDILLDQKSKNNLEELADIIRNNPHEAIAFVGAGISKPLGLGLWEDFLGRVCFASGNEKTCREIEDIKDGLQKEGKIGSLPEVASTLLPDSKYKEKDISAFIEKAINMRDINYTPIHKKIIDIFRIIVTTNYDFAFKFAVDEKKRYRLTEQRRINEIKTSFALFLNGVNDRHVVYLHGCAGDTCLLREEEYNKYYITDNTLGELVRVIIKNHVVCYFGFGFRDIYYLNLIQEIKDIQEKRDQSFARCDSIKENKYRHYAFVDEESIKKEVAYKVKGKDGKDEEQKVMMSEYLDKLYIKPIIKKKNSGWYVTEDLLEYLERISLKPDEKYKKGEYDE